MGKFSSNKTLKWTIYKKKSTKVIKFYYKNKPKQACKT